MDLTIQAGFSSSPRQGMVDHLQIHLSPAGIERLVQGAIYEANRTGSTRLWFESCETVADGIEIGVGAKKGPFTARVQISALLSAHKDEWIMIDLRNVHAPAWVPIGMVMGRVVKSLTRKPGFAPAQGGARIVYVKPAILLGRNRMTRLTPGKWTVQTTSYHGLSLTYAPLPG